MFVKTVYDLALELADLTGQLHVPAGTRLEVDHVGAGRYFGEVFWVHIDGYDDLVPLQAEEVEEVS